VDLVAVVFELPIGEEESHQAKYPNWTKEEHLLAKHVRQVAASFFVKQREAVSVADWVLKLADGTGYLLGLDDQLSDAAPVPSLVAKARSNKCFFETSFFLFHFTLIFILYIF